MKHKPKNRHAPQPARKAGRTRRKKIDGQNGASSSAITLRGKALFFCAVEPDGSRNGADVVQIYFREVGRYPLLERGGEVALIRRMRGGDEAARERLITSHLRLVVKIARGFDGMGVPLLDLISEGNIGLMKAVERYKADRGTSLAVYASFWIKQRIRLALANHSRTIRVPVHVHEKLFQVRRAAAQLRDVLGREPSEEEISQAMRIPAARLRKWQEAGRSTVSMDQPLDGDGDLLVGGLISDANTRPPDEVLADVQTLDGLSKFVAALPPGPNASLPGGSASTARANER